MAKNPVDQPIHGLMQNRWSPYAFDPSRSVATEDLAAIFEAARWAASAYNAQPWRYIVGVKGRNDEVWERIHDQVLVEGNQAWTGHAPVLALGIVRSAYEHNDKPNGTAEHDLGAASASLTLEATARGLVVHQMGGILPDVAADLFDDILDRSPTAVLSMEFYERDDQTALDDYVAGITSADEFDRATFRNAGNNPPGHRRMVEAARLAGRPVVGSNAPRRYARLARTEGFDRLRSLTPVQRRHFDIPDALPDNAYGSRFRAAMSSMGGHGSMGDSTEDPITGFLRSQTLWDVTMAESIADATAQGSPVVHVVGRFHSEFGTEPGKSGLADAVAQRIQPEQRMIIITVVDTDAPSLRVEDVGRGHFVIYVGPLPEPDPA
jgi:uncharacterized iron-regulated protein